MKKIFLLLVLAFSSLSQIPMGFTQIATLSKIPLGAVQPPAVQIETLSNGMKVYLLEDSELPIFQAFAYIKAGSVYDPMNQTGLASVLGTVLRTGGTLEKKPAEIDRLLDDRGASLETGMAGEYGTASVSGLSKDVSVLVPLFFEVLSSPQFENSATQLSIARKIESLKRINDEPEKIAVREFPKLMYGPDSAWGRTPTAASLLSIRKSDLQKYHGQFYHPDQVTLAIAGDFKKAEMLALLEKATQAWKKSDGKMPALPEVKKEWDKGIYLINKPGGQSTIVIGHYGDKRDNPDKFALILMNYRLGGDIFSSKLGEEVRSNRGWAYSIYSRFALETVYGLFYAIAQTKTASTSDVIGLVAKIISDFHEGEGFSGSSLGAAKSAILNQLMGDWDPRFGYVKERARLSYFHYPENYLDVFQKKLGAVTVEEVRKVAKQYLYPDKLKILVVGDAEKLKASLEKYGTVKELPLPSL